MFNGSDASETIELSANGPRLRLVRDVDTITIDMDATEQVSINALGGPDTLTTNDLSGTDVVHVTSNLAAAGGSDGLADSVVVNGTTGADIVSITDAAGTITVAGLNTGVSLSGSEATLDRLLVNGLAGSDTITREAKAAEVFKRFPSACRERKR